MSREVPDTREMFMVHTMFRREFAALPTLVRGVPAGETERADLIAEHIVFLAAVLQAHHHSEDIHLWPKLVERSAVDIGPVVRFIEAQRERIEQLTSQALLGLGEWREGAATARREALAAVLQRLNTVLYDYMGREERRIMPLAEKYITAAEWRAMANHSGAAMPEWRVLLIFGMVLYEADPEVMENTLSSFPSVARELLKLRGAQEFAAYAERVHGTRTPFRSVPFHQTTSESPIPRGIRRR